MSISHEQYDENCAQSCSCSFCACVMKNKYCDYTK